jgi:hypothetical protein
MRPPAPTIATSDRFATTVTANGQFVLAASGQIAMAATTARLERGSRRNAHKPLSGAGVETCN